MHFKAYQAACEKYGKDNTYIVTNHKLDKRNDILSATEKRTLINEVYDIGLDFIKISASPFNPVEFFESFEEKKIIFVFIAWDSIVEDNLSKHYKKYEDTNVPGVYYGRVFIEDTDIAPDVIRNNCYQLKTRAEVIGYLDTIYKTDKKHIIELIASKFENTVQNALFFVRHGLRIDHIDKKWKSPNGRSFDPPLSPEGKVQAQKLATRLKTEGITQIICSPAIRCVETASEVAKILEINICIEPGVGEFINSRVFTDPPTFFTAQELSGMYSQIDLTYVPVLEKVANVETFEQLDKRCEQVVNGLKDKIQQRTLVVTHGGPITSLVGGFISGLNVAIKNQECVLTKIVKVDDVWTLESNGEERFLYTGSSERDMTDPRYKQWRYAVMARDNFTCALTGQKGGELEVHHIKRWADHPELRYSVANGITLSKDAHQRQVTGQEDQYEDYFLEIVRNKMAIQRKESKSQFSNGGKTSTKIVGETKTGKPTPYFPPNPRARL